MPINGRREVFMLGNSCRLLTVRRVIGSVSRECKRRVLGLSKLALFERNLSGSPRNLLLNICADTDKRFDRGNHSGTSLRFLDRFCSHLLVSPRFQSNNINKLDNFRKRIARVATGVAKE